MRYGTRRLASCAAIAAALVTGATACGGTPHRAASGSALAHVLLGVKDLPSGYRVYNYTGEHHAFCSTTPEKSSPDVARAAFINDSVKSDLSAIKVGVRLHPSATAAHDAWMRSVMNIEACKRDKTPHETFVHHLLPSPGIGSSSAAVESTIDPTSLSAQDRADHLPLPIDLSYYVQTGRGTIQVDVIGSAPDAGLLKRLTELEVGRFHAAY